MARLAPSRAVRDVPKTIHVESVFPDGGPIPARYTCDGEELSPSIAWRGIPGDTVEIAVTLEDPDAPRETFVHWMVAGIDSASLGLEAGLYPHGAVAGVNDFGELGYAGPCPPGGEEAHRYVLTVFACSAGLGLSGGFTAAELHDAVEGQVLAIGQLTGIYERAP
ncbi:MAG: YbhB/YbcL family Raf kinase inhibitor-like protein [Actinomycetota bacterium]|nr:YbhB/YbcL family Raf kinase inhibitor-like protein [Actinomycetota bacterium]